MVRYEVKQNADSKVLADVRSDKIAIPELQRPFVWRATQVRDLVEPYKTTGGGRSNGKQEIRSDQETTL